MPWRGIVALVGSAQFGGSSDLMERRLATILAADAVGYSGRMAADELATLSSLASVRALVERRVEEFSGRIFSTAGDGFLAEFSSPISGVRAGFEIQRDVASLRRRDPSNLELRIGVHLADVVAEEGDLLGDGVNVAARIEGAAAPGSVTISQPVFEQVKRGARLTFDSLGAHVLKGLPEPIHLYRVVDQQEATLYMSGEPKQSAETTKLPSSSARRPSIVVLPLVNISGDPEQDYFADGLTDDLITNLARFQQLMVLSRNASFAYRNRNVDPRQIARELGVTLCLEGSVRKLPNHVRITAQLIDAASGEHVWADRFDAPMEDLFDIQDEIAAKIVATIVGRVEARQTAVARVKRPSDLDAYDCLLKGLDYHRRGGVTRDDAERAVLWFKKAIEKDPNYARANAWCACAIGATTRWEGIRWQDDAADPLSMLERALELDENDAEVHRMMGEWNVQTRNYKKAEQHFLRAMQLNPSHSFVVARTARFYNVIGEPGKAMEMLDRAKRLDPLLPDYCREMETVTLYLMERHQDVLELNSQLRYLTMRAAAYGSAASTHIRNAAEVREVRDALLRLAPHFTVSSFVSGEAFKEASQSERLRDDLLAAELPH